VLIECLVTLVCTPDFSSPENYIPRASEEMSLIRQSGAEPPVSDDEIAGPVPGASIGLLSEGHTEPAMQVPEVWRSLAMCESGMSGSPRWDYNGSSGFDGGIQFLPQTWTAFKPDSFPRYAFQATPYEQITVGKLVAEVQGAGAWPSCTSSLGISTYELLNA
jgi:hypothetical protein